MVTIDKNRLLTVLNKAASVTEKKATMPVLECLALTVAGRVLTVKAYDLEVAYEGHVAVDSDGALEALVSAKALTQVVAAMPEGPLSLVVQKGKVVVTSGLIEYRLGTMALVEFPALPAKVDGIPVKMDGGAFVQGLAEVAYAQNTDETRYSLCGTFVEGSEGRVLFTATDGHRLGHGAVTVEGVEAFPGIILSRKTTALLRKVVTPTGLATFVVSENAITYETEAERVTARLIDGQFPDYRAIVPEYEHSFTVDREAFTAALGRMKLVGDSVVLVMENDQLTLSASDPDRGTATDVLTVGGDGKLKARFSLHYLRDALVWPVEQVEVFFGDDLTPLCVRPAGSESAFGIVMPMRS